MNILLFVYQTFCAMHDISILSRWKRWFFIFGINEIYDKFPNPNNNNTWHFVRSMKNDLKWFCSKVNTFSKQKSHQRHIISLISDYVECWTKISLLHANCKSTIEIQIENELNRICFPSFAAVLLLLFVGCDFREIVIWSVLFGKCS